MEERATILLHLARDERTAGHHGSAKAYEDRAAESQTHAQTIRNTCSKRRDIGLVIELFGFSQKTHQKAHRRPSGTE